jgi:hypothetical protein
VKLPWNIFMSPPRILFFDEVAAGSERRALLLRLQAIRQGDVVHFGGGGSGGSWDSGSSSSSDTSSSSDN